MTTPALLQTIICGWLLVVPARALRAQSNKEVVDENLGWFSLNSTIRVYKKVGLVADLHMRRTHFLDNPGFYFARVGANYWVKENLAATVGYAHMWVAPSKESWQHYGEEHRLYQQLQVNLKLGKLSFLSRLRNEQRWQQKIVEDRFIHRYKFTNRTRVLSGITIPVSRHVNYPSLVLSDELAVQFGKETPGIFDQNRLFIGIKQPLTKAISFDIGYMRIYQQKSVAHHYARYHTFRCFFYFTPDLRKKQVQVINTKPNSHTWLLPA
jgi:hypothetical protein